MTMIPDPNDQVVDPPVSNDDIDAFIKQLEGGYGENINLSTLFPQGTTDEPDGDEPEEPEPEDEETPGDDSITINGNVVSRADIERLYSFDQWMRANPDKAQRMAEAMSDQAPTGLPPISETTPPTHQEFQPPTLPEGFELDDPQIKFLWDQNVALQKSQWDQSKKINDALANLVQQQQSQVQRQAAEDMDRVLIQFRTNFPSLNEDEVSSIRRDAGSLLPNFLSTLPPVQALYRSMEVAAWANADIRIKLNDPEAKPTPTEKQRSTTRKQKLTSLSSTPTPAPKTDARPVFQTDRDMVNQFAKELSENGLGR